MVLSSGGDGSESHITNLNNHLQLNITVKAQKQGGSYLHKCYQGDFKSGSPQLSFK